MSHQSISDTRRPCSVQMALIRKTGTTFPVLSKETGDTDNKYLVRSEILGLKLLLLFFGYNNGDS